MIMDFDPADSWRHVKIPVLLFFGEFDVAVPPIESWPPIERSLAAAGNRQVTHYVLPNANHVFFEVRTGQDEYDGAEPLRAGVLRPNAEWLRPYAR
jgi:pimeloyl-ACP methyl ester carboxylesterase